ncbi:MAG: class I SAM-dependent methyltransferase [Actinomycetota bacterium]
MPTLRAAGARRIVEIGALRGETTVKMIDELGPDTELHVIDPVPEFDPTVHERKFPGQYIFHRDLSLNVLADLPPMDAALIDGDHNWYTVFNECRLLHEVAEAAGMPLPLMLLHDVEWPYGRRDLYYDPSNIPVDEQRPHRRAGINLRTNKLMDRGGFNKTLHNAEAYGGPQNGVMTGLEDFLDTFDRPYRHITLPIYYGLSLVAEDALLDAKPELAAFFDRLEANDGKDEVIELSETIRLEAANMEQAYLGEFMRQVDVLRTRQLDYVKSAVVNDLHPDAELRGDGDANDPVRADRVGASALAEQRANGDGGASDGRFALTSVGRLVLDALHGWLDELSVAQATGAMVEIGAGRGGVGVFIASHSLANFRRGVRTVVVDRFDSASGGDLNTVRDAYERFDLLDEDLTFLMGDPAEAIAGHELSPVALCWIDACLLDDPEAAYRAIEVELPPGARVAVHTDGSEEAAERWRALAAGAGLERPVPTLVGWRIGDDTSAEERSA